MLCDMRICCLLVGLVLPWMAHAGPQRVQAQHARIEGRLLAQLERTTSRPGVKQEAADRFLERYGHLDLRRVRKVACWRATLPDDPPQTSPTDPPEPVETR